MKSIRRTILGILLLLLIAAAGAGTYAYFLWNRSDELLRQLAHEKLNEIAPGWNISIGSAHFDFQGQVHLYHVVIPGDDPATPILDAPEVVLAFDAETLADPRPRIRHVRVLQPRIGLVRRRDGRWNFLELPPLRNPLAVVPEFHWERGQVDIRPTDDPGRPAEPARLENVEVRMIPSGKRQFVIKACANVTSADQLTADGKWNLDDGAWSAAGEARNLRIDRRLLEAVSEFSPDFSAQLGRLEAALVEWDREQSASLADRMDVQSPSRAGPAEFSAAANLLYRFSRWQPGAAVERHLQLQFLRGEWTHPLIPYPLRELRGQVTIDDDNVRVTEVTAVSGGIHFRAENGRVRRDGERNPADFDLVITDLPFDERLYRILPVEIRRVYDSVQPGGMFDARFHFEFNGCDRWEHDGDLTIRDGTVCHVSFPYRVENIKGTIKRRGELVELELSGLSSSRRVSLRGKVKNPGAQAAALFDIETAGLPIDEKLRAACQPEFRDVIDRLGLQGELDGLVRLSRRAGPNERITPYIKGRLHHGAIQSKDFAYPLSDVSGQFEGTLDDWTFAEFQGRQGTAVLNWSGTWQKGEDGAPRLGLTFEARDAECDRVLFGALPDEWKEIWIQLNPQGLLHAAGTMEWSPGSPPDVALDAEFREGKLDLKSFPLPLDGVRADVSYAGNRVTIRSFSGRHDDTQFRAEGWVDFPEPGEWRVHLEKLYVDGLVADRSLRKALPPRLLAVVDAFNPRGKLSISGMLDFRGKSSEVEEYPVTAAWDTETVFTGNTLTAGVDLRDMHGKSRFRGTWDGEAVAGKGWIQLDTLKVFGYELTQVSGPVSINRDRLIVGSRRSGGANARDSQAKERLTARFIEGVIGLDAEVHLGEKMRYDTRITLSNGDLRRYAHSYMASNHKLAGRMDGEVELSGEGIDPKRLGGAGRLTISKAALYELPLIVAIFQTLSLTRPKDAAFDQAQFDFKIGNSEVRFQRIDLVGDAIRLIGWGKVRFDRTVDLDFYSTVGRNQLAVPVIRDLVNVGTSGLVRVKVGGTVQNPSSQMTPLPQFDDALRQLLGGFFDPRGPARR